MIVLIFYIPPFIGFTPNIASVSISSRIDLDSYSVTFLRLVLTTQVSYCLAYDHEAYTLSHPENDRDVTERAQGNTLQDASFMRQSLSSFLNVWDNTQVARAMTSVFIRTMRRRHSRSWGETKYSHYNLDSGVVMWPYLISLVVESSYVF